MLFRSKQAAFNCFGRATATLDNDEGLLFSGTGVVNRARDALFTRAVFTGQENCALDLRRAAGEIAHFGNRLDRKSVV